MFKKRFEKSRCFSPTGLKYVFYRRYAKRVVPNQITPCDVDNAVVFAGNAMSFLYSLEAKISSHGCKAVEHAIKSSKDSLVFWEAKQTDEVSSIVECLELFSVRSPTALSVGSLQFYFVHETLLKIQERVQMLDDRSRKNCR